MTWSFERAIWSVLIFGALFVGSLQAFKAATYDPRPAAVVLGTAMVCDRNGCTES